jgi:hypothetical protein
MSIVATPSAITSRRALQAVLVAIAAVLVVTGIMGVVGGVFDPFYDLKSRADPSGGKILLDSNVRFFGGMSAGVGLVLLSIVPAVERHARLLRLTSVVIFAGGIGRVVSMIDVGAPSLLFIAFTLTSCVPLLAVWQHVVAHPRR